MKLLIRSAMIFFGTLMAAGLLALGEPAATRLPAAAQAHRATPAQHPLQAQGWNNAAQQDH